VKKTAGRRGATAPDVDAYLADVPAASRKALQRLRAIVKAAAPKSTEGISYQIPTVTHEGRHLVAFAAFTHHCSLFVMSRATVGLLKRELEGYSTQTGTIRFTPDAPLPAALVKKIVKMRVAENEARRRAKKRAVPVSGRRASPAPRR
jgi:uncharacterized protein YdhG (YjbR/CyaY superfamily)